MYTHQATLSGWRGVVPLPPPAGPKGTRGPSKACTLPSCGTLLGRQHENAFI